MKMKMWKKLLSVIVVGSMTCSLLAGCGSTAGGAADEKQRSETTSESARGETETGGEQSGFKDDAGVDENAPSFQFGFIHTSFSDQLGVMYQKYATYAAEALGCEMMYAEFGSDADLCMSSLENMIQVGCDGIVVSRITEPMLEACQKAGVYLIQVGSSIADPALAEIADANPYYIGSVLVDNVEVGYNMTAAMYEQGCRNVAVLQFTPGTVTTMDERAAGIEQFLEEHPDMEVATTFSGGAASFAEGAEQILASYPDIDGIISVMANTSIASSIYTFGLSDQVKYAGVDIQEGTNELLESGTMAYVAGGAFPNAEICVAMLYNYLTDYQIWEDSLENIRRPLVELQSVEDYNDYMLYMEGELPVYSGEELRSIVGYYNPDVTWEDICALALDSSLESVKERHAGMVTE